MAKTTKNALSSFERWSITGWSVTFKLLTLYLRDFVTAPEDADEESYYAASWSFVGPSRVKFSNFTASNQAMIQQIHVTPPAKGLTMYRFEFGGDSFIEIVARDCSTVQW